MNTGKQADAGKIKTPGLVALQRGQQVSATAQGRPVKTGSADKSSPCGLRLNKNRKRGIKAEKRDGLPAFFI